MHFYELIPLVKCDAPLGLQDGRVEKSMFTASSMYNHYYGPWSARLQARNHGATRGGWLARYNNRKQWLQIDLAIKALVKRIATQGRYDANQWVTSYTVSSSLKGLRFRPYKEGTSTKVSVLQKCPILMTCIDSLRLVTSRSPIGDRNCSEARSLVRGLAMCRRVVTSCDESSNLFTTRFESCIH